MIAKLRGVLIAAKYRPAHTGEPTAAEIHVIRLAWEGARRGITAKVEWPRLIPALTDSDTVKVRRLNSLNVRSRVETA